MQLIDGTTAHGYSRPYSRSFAAPASHGLSARRLAVICAIARRWSAGAGSLLEKTTDTQHAICTQLLW